MAKTRPPKSPLAPDHFPELPPIAGVRFSTIQTGERYGTRPDVLLVELARGTHVAGVFTRSRTASAPVEWCRRVITVGAGRALLVNAGNANAFTGKRGVDAVERCAEHVARALGCEPAEVLLASTGVVGEPLETGPILQALSTLCGRLGADGWEAAATAISTTDTFSKGAGTRVTLGGREVSIVGIAKGSGMIAPDMATMLSFVFTDAKLPQEVLQRLLAEANERTFNNITVDSDTSTSDTLLLFATGQAENREFQDAHAEELAQFRSGLRAVLDDLSKQVVRDGEGASKFISIEVRGAASDVSAKRIALSVANSPLVKTAIAGEDANWGRVVMAVGKAGEPADRDEMSIRFGQLPVADKGERSPAYDEAALSRYMKGTTIDVWIDVGVGGPGEARVWTCDLTHGYISINADYRS